MSGFITADNNSLASNLSKTCIDFIVLAPRTDFSHRKYRYEFYVARISLTIDADLPQWCD